jgi:capsular polysaccharide biosynthesis protein
LFYKEFTVSFFVKMVLKHLRLIVLLTVVGGILCLLYSNFFITPVYTAKAMIMIQNYTIMDAANDAAEEAAESGVDDTQSQQEDIEDTTSSFGSGPSKIYSSDISASATLAEYCTTLFMNNVEIDKLLNGCTMDITPENETSFLWVTMTSSDPQVAADTCNTVVNRIAGTDEETGLFNEIFVAGGASVTKYATVPSSSTYPDVKSYALYGLVGGLALAVVISFILEIIDTTVKYEDDLFKLYNVPVFGEILDFNQNGDAKYESKNTYYK